MTDESGKKPVHSPEEMCVIIDGFSKDEMNRLFLYATRLANTLGGVEARDLLHHALVKSTIGERRCPRDTNPLTFLCNAMKSELSNLRRKSKLTESVTDQEYVAEGIDDDTPESLVERTDEVTWAIEQIKEAFGDDERPLLILEGRAAGLSREEIRGLVEMEPVAFESLERKIRRFLNAKFSERRAK